VVTSGDRSHGMLAQSVGGSGGAGGFSVAGGISKSASVNLGLGGGGGEGSSAGPATLTSSSSVYTAGADAHGLFAQSVGGGGGAGGFAIAGGVSTESAQVAAAVGGSGGGGSVSGKVTVTSTGDLIGTSGDRSYGLLAQSIGGSGGNGGFAIAGGISKSATVNFGMGGGGGSGSRGGEVSVGSASSVATLGSGAHALFAQSVGGGGGSGGFSVVGGVSRENAQISASIGGKGGGGGDASLVRLSSTGEAVETGGERAFGIFVQSVGGGGGDGGFSLAGGTGKKASINFGMGGRGGTAGEAGDVVLENDSSIFTMGGGSHAVVVQSVGGGGGAGGFAATGSLMQGSESKQVSAAIGGQGGGGGNAGAVSAQNSGSIETLGTRAFGVLAQSVGGGGGDGGDAHVVNLVTEGDEPKPEDRPDPGDGTDPGSDDSQKEGSKSWSVGLAIGAGGAGGAAGDGGKVSLSTDGGVLTHGAGSHALFAQSVGGGGGAGGMATTDGSGGGGDIGIELGFSLGGRGGGGGSAADVNLSNAGTLVTLGDNGHGIVAQSIGGGGGSGGASASTSKAANSEAKLAVNVNAAIGGDGGVAGDAGQVWVSHDGRIDTSGTRAYGVLAQSIGGGGGDGGNSTARIEAGDDEEEQPSLPQQEENDDEEEAEELSWSVGLAIGAGGTGGSAGDGGAVIIESGGDVITRGDGSHALFAQSIGGGGGAAGSSITDSSGGGGNVGIEIGFSLGGRGGAGGSAGPVRVTSTGSLVTTGDGAHGIVAQSVGGGGGSGGASISRSAPAAGDEQVGLNLNVAVGGAGGVAGDGGAVLVQNDGLIDTSGRSAFGVLAQSIGGGGGDGSMSVSAPGGGQSSLLDLAVSVGGRGGVAGASGAVMVRNAGGIVTRGDDAHAIFAQGVGGGGGSGGSSIATSGANQGLGIDFGIGGGGGAGNDGGAVMIVNEGDLDTFGRDAHGVLAQSIGGGGGRGGNAGVIERDSAGQPGDENDEPSGWSLALSVGGSGGGASDGGQVWINNVGEVRTRGAGAFGIMLQSVGGGGGDGGYGGYANLDEAGGDTSLDLHIAVGGRTGSSGHGGNVTLAQSGNVSTGGEGAIGLFAQSIGGGGGTGGLGIAGSLGSVAIGGAGGAAGDGGDVEVTLGGDLSTSGTAAHGVFAQSIGGGGGMAGDVSAGFGDDAQIGLGLAFGQAGGGGGNGGLVRVGTSGSISTAGDAAAGIFAQSVGGGGGLSGDALGTLAFAGSVGGVGAGGPVEVVHAGDILTTGAGSPGVFAQSMGGESVAGDSATGSAVSVTVDGAIVASGEGSPGILLQSFGVTGGEDLTVNVAGGRVRGGTAGASGIVFLGGRHNSLVNRGEIGAAGGIDGSAIHATGGDVRITNYGILVGQIDLGPGSNALRNEAGAVIASGSRIDLGAGNLLSNAGTISVAGTGRVGSTVLNGDLESTSSGVLALDVDLGARQADRLEIEGTASVAGRLEVSFSGGASAARQDYLLVAGSEAASSVDPELEFVDLPPAMTAWRMDAGSIGIGVSLEPDFTMRNMDLTVNASSVARYLNAVVQAEPGEAMQRLLDAVVQRPTAQAVEAAMLRLEPESLLTLSPTTLRAVLQFTGALHSCPVREGPYRFNAEGDCTWAEVGGRWLDQDGYGDFAGFRRDGTVVTVGGQRAVEHGLAVGLGFSYESSRTDVEDLARIDGDQFELGVILKAQRAATSFSGAVSVGLGRFDTTRWLNLPDPGDLTRGRQELTSWGASARVSHDFLRENWYLRPTFDVSATYLDFDAWTERGSTAASATVGPRSETYATLQPGLEIGGESGTSDGTLFRPFVRLGATWVMSDASASGSAALAGSPSSVEPFEVRYEFDDTYLDVAAGLDILRRNGATVRIGYFGQFAEGTDEHSALLKLRWPF
jgi:hypothetical protein